MVAQARPITVTQISALAAAALLVGVAASSEAHAGNVGTTCKSYHHPHCATSDDPGRSSPKKIVRDHRSKPIVRDHRAAQDHRGPGPNTK